MNSLAIARTFVEQINAHDVNALTALMTDDHRFIDSLGQVVSGRPKLHAAWVGYFGLIPDYQITAAEWFSIGTVVVLLGAAGGSYHGVRWETPIACRAQVRDGQIAEWRVYADNEPLRQLMKG